MQGIDQGSEHLRPCGIVYIDGRRPGGRNRQVRDRADDEAGRSDPRTEGSAELASRLNVVLGKIAADAYGELYFPLI